MRVSIMKMGALLATATIATPPVAATLPVSASDDHAAQVSRRILVALSEANGVPGMGAAIWRGDRLIWTGSAGQRDVERKLPVDEQTIFRLASVSKLLAATAAAKLREQGRLDVDAPISTIVPYLGNDWPAISARQLAAHVSGIPHYQPIDESRGGHRFASVRESVGVFSGRPLLFAPGARYSYSSYGFTLLTAAIEAGSGQSYLDYVAKEIVPGMAIGPDSTGTRNPSASKAYAVANATVTEVAPHDYSYSWGGAGMGATPAALATFGGRLMTGKIVSRATLDWMLQPAKLANGSKVRDDEYEIGFGWRTQRDVDGERTAHHAGVTSGARSALVLYPDKALAVSLLSNALWVSSIEQSAMTIAAPFRPLDPPEPARACPVNMARFEGSFGGKPIAGSARFMIDGGICTGEISASNALGTWLNGFPQKDAVTLRLIGMDPAGGFSRAALITPVGAFDLRASGALDQYQAALAGARTLRVRFAQ
ncbi:MAG: beta-lactamase family protein [Sphingomonas bacterium]|nr:beta-lactamase family protein [Sphingomonas bacterium]